MLEIRKNSYRNKTSILLIDRRKEFKKKLLSRNNPTKAQPDKVVFDERF